MTTLTAHQASDMTTWDLTEIDDGTVANHTATKWEVINSAFLLDFVFNGTGLTYPGGADPKPNGGTIHSFNLKVNGHNALDVVGDVSASKSSHFIATNNMAAWEKLWFNGNDTFKGSAEDDHLLGYDGKDVFNLAKGGDDTAEGGDGDDVFNMGNKFDGSDHVMGGDGDDTIVLKGNYHQMFGGLNSVEKILLKPGFSYELLMSGTAIDSGGLVFDGSALQSGDVMNIGIGDGPRGVTIVGGAAGDTFYGANRGDVFNGGAGDDLLIGYGGADRLRGGANADRFSFHDVWDSNSAHYDTVVDFRGGVDHFGFDFAVTGVHTPVHHALSTATFDGDLEDALGATELAKHGAVLLVANSGDLDGDTFLIVNANGKAGYQAGKDFVMLMEDTSHLSINPTSFALNN